MMKTLTVLISTVVSLIICLAVIKTNCYNDDRGIVKWNPYWFSNFRYSAPVFYYGGSSSGGGGGGGIGRSGLPKRLGDRSSSFGSQIYKWSPVYFADRGGLFGRTGGFGTNRYSNVVSDGLLDEFQND